MDQYQINLIANTFFKPDDDKYPGWKGIAEKLIATGECIVAGNDKIWYGGVGNFISTENIEEAVGCVKLKFDIDNFKKTSMYKLQIDDQINKVTAKINILNQELQILNNM